MYAVPGGKTNRWRQIRMSGAVVEPDRTIPIQRYHEIHRTATIKRLAFPPNRDRVRIRCVYVNVSVIRDQIVP